MDNMPAAKRILLFEEYAKVTSIMDTTQMDLFYYVDEAGECLGYGWSLNTWKGPIPKEYIAPVILDRQPAPNLNADMPPQWGVDLRFHDTMVHYGPWADRQRYAREWNRVVDGGSLTITRGFLQSFFYPYAFRSFPPTKLPREGEPRLHAAFQLHVEFQGETTWRVPTRESSKVSTALARLLAEGVVVYH